MSIEFPIYLDNNATTPLDPRVLAVMAGTLRDHFGNPASKTHSHGWFAEELVTIAREQVAKATKVQTDEVIFTSGGTESNNLAIKGLISSAKESGPGIPHVITCSTEHKAVLDPLRALEKRRELSLSVLPVNSSGQLDPKTFMNAIRPETLLASIMLANNEIGVIHDIKSFSEITRSNGIIFHCDATQALGKIEVSPKELGVDLLTISAHKVYGPKGVGALYVRRGVKLNPLIDGGGHENGLRSGTLNVPGIVGFGKACELASEESLKNRQHLENLTSLFLTSLRTALPSIRINGSTTNRIPGNLNVLFAGVDNVALLGRIASKLSLSIGSACTSASKTPSYVLSALGLSDAEQRSSIRVGIGVQNTTEEISFAAQTLIEAVSGSVP